MNSRPTKFAFFGSSDFSISVLKRLEDLGLVPEFVVTTADKPVGRKLILTPNVVKVWAKEKDIPVFDPVKLDGDFAEQLEKFNKKDDGTEKCPVFLVASYGKIIPKSVIDLPSRKTLNIHPSLLPKYRGPSPLPTTILEDEKDTGVSIMELDQEMDHGPIVSQKKIHMESWPVYEVFEKIMAEEGAGLFAEILPKWIDGAIQAKEQDHSKASYTKKIMKEDGLIDLGDSAYKNFRKIQAFHKWPQAYFFINHQDRDVRIKVTEADFRDDKLEIKKVIPEGGKEISYEDFKRGYLKLS